MPYITNLDFPQLSDDTLKYLFSLKLNGKHSGIELNLLIYDIEVTEKEKMIQ